MDILQLAAAAMSYLVILIQFQSSEEDEPIFEDVNGGNVTSNVSINDNSSETFFF